jgi:hypothetical protein
MPFSPRLDFRHWSEVDSITNRTAVYGPVRTVVWEGRRSDPSPYPDRNACSTVRRRSLATVAAPSGTRRVRRNSGAARPTRHPYIAAGRMFWFTRNRLPGSYFLLTAARRT